MAEGPRRVRRLCGAGGGGGAGLRFNAQVRHKKSSLPRGPFDNDTAADFADDLDDAAAEKRENLIRGVGLPPERCPQGLHRGSVTGSGVSEGTTGRQQRRRTVRSRCASTTERRTRWAAGQTPTRRRPPTSRPGPVGRRSTKTGADNVNRSATDQDTDRARGRTSRPPRISCGCAGSRSDRPTPRCSAGPPPHP
ncbi:DUF4259 domain-containing protein [Streptomyces sp. NPDC046984]|uniref:DUF4259 domain-containing protein n=1 Tax=Streptomyces sp. NPDC046984 TaxID=3155138 RepID=UPI0033C337CC